MIVIDLSRLRVGDVILESSTPELASGTGGKFGHASVALGRLLLIEAGSTNGVVLTPLYPERFSHGEEVIIGMIFDEDQTVLVRRRIEVIDIGTLLGEAFWEAGRSYGIQKLLSLPDLTVEAKKLLNWKLRHAEEGDIEDRFCSEVVARVLRLGDYNVSPNALASDARFESVLEAVRILDDSWSSSLLDDECTAVEALVADFSSGQAARLRERGAEVARELRAAVQEGAPVSESMMAEAVKQLDTATTTDVSRNLEIIGKVYAIERCLFGF